MHPWFFHVVLFSWLYSILLSVISISTDKTYDEKKNPFCSTFWHPFVGITALQCGVGGARPNPLIGWQLSTETFLNKHGETTEQLLLF